MDIAKRSVGGYCITLNCVRATLPFKESIKNHLKFCDFVAVVDGGSDDGTWEDLVYMAENPPYKGRLIVEQSAWNYDLPNMMGIQKTRARQLVQDRCSYLWQFDADEFLPAWQHEAVQSQIRNNPTVELFCFPCITFHGGMVTTGPSENCYKWRLSKNSPNIIHDVPFEHRQYHEDGRMFFSREKSDSCEYICKNTGKLIHATLLWDQRLVHLNHRFRAGQELGVEEMILYKKLLSGFCNGTEIPCVFHYSWVDYNRKIGMERFWIKQARFHESTGAIPRNAGKWINKPIEEITEADIEEYAESLFDTDQVIPLDVKKHPEDIIKFALNYNWNQIGQFLEGDTQ